MHKHQKQQSTSASNANDSAIYKLTMHISNNHMPGIKKNKNVIIIENSKKVKSVIYAVWKIQKKTKYQRKPRPFGIQQKHKLRNVHK